MRNVQFVFFDAGGVLFLDLMDQGRWDAFLEKIGIPQNGLAEFNSFYDQYEALLNKGKLHADDFWKKANKELSLNIELPGSFQDLMVQEFQPNPLIKKVLTLAQQKYRIGVLTNMYPGMFQQITQRGIIPQANYEVIVDSSKVGLAKPDPAIYEYSQQLIKVPPEEILFIDNSQRNLEGAKKVGWQTFWYNGNTRSKSTQELHDLLSRQ